MPTNGKTIIKDAVALCSYLSDYGVDQSNAIASTHSYVFDEKTPWNVIREVADACQTSGGAVGFDGYVDAPGNLWIFQRNSSNSTVDLTDKILHYKIDYDVYRVKNKIKVYGKAAKNFPSNLDSWSESLNGWTCDSGSMSLNSTQQRKGTYCLQVNTPSGGGVASVYRTFDTLVKPQTFVVWARMPGNLGGGYAYVRLAAPDWSNYFQADIKSFLENNCINTWALLSLALGSGNMYNADNNPTGAWTVGAGNPQWNQISGLKLIANCVGSTSYFLWDGDFGFLNCTFSGIAEDSTSQGLYGVRMCEPITDDSLASDDECVKKAQSLLVYYKDRVTTLTLTTFGDNNFKPGDKLHVVLSNDNIDDYFRILEVRHTLRDVYWQTELLLSNEPIMVDYVFRKMFEAQKTIASNQ